MKPEAFLVQLINGLQLGSIYALIALGYTMVYGIVKLINFAHGDILMVGSYVIMFMMGTVFMVDSVIARVAAVAAALYLRHLIHACRAIDSYDGAEEILHFLREKFEEVEE